MDTEVKNWLDFAKRDLDVARHLNTAFYPKPLEIVCYHCQQAAEKAIKAVIISLGSPGGLPKRHDLSFFCWIRFIIWFVWMMKSTTVRMPCLHMG